MKVNIYTYTTLKSPRQRNGGCVYVIETKDAPPSRTNPLTASGPITEASLHEAQAVTLLRALRRLKGSSDVEINTASPYIGNGIAYLPRHAENGWKDAKGKSVKYADLWQEIADILKKQASVHVTVAPDNEWAAWMQEEAERKKS